MHDITIKTSGITAEIVVDGVKIPDAVGYTITHNAGKLPVLNIKLVGNITLDSQMLLPLPEPWCSFYEEKPHHNGAAEN